MAVRQPLGYLSSQTLFRCRSEAACMLINKEGGQIQAKDGPTLCNALILTKYKIVFLRLTFLRWRQKTDFFYSMWPIVYTKYRFVFEIQIRMDNLLCCAALPHYNAPPQIIPIAGIMF